MADRTAWLTIAHSPDPDDVFMWWPLGSRSAQPDIDTAPFRFDPLPEDIQALNRRAIEHADLDITAVSIHAYPHLHHRYRLTDCAGSFGEGYGPRLVVPAGSGAPPEGAPTEELRQWLNRPGLRLAVPGLNTTAYLTLCLLAGRRLPCHELPFHEIPRAVASARADAGLLIHDAQLTFRDAGLRAAADLGRWWQDDTDLPLPLGGNALRRDLDDRFGPGACERIAAILRRSIEHALDNRERGLERIAHMTIGLDRGTLHRYLDMYVSPLTLSAGERGRRAIDLLLSRGALAGLCPPAPPADILNARTAG